MSVTRCSETLNQGMAYPGMVKLLFLKWPRHPDLQLLKKDERNPLINSTVGTGDLIRHALDTGVEQIIMGVGGSATNDGGMGMAHALGVVFYSASGDKLIPIGENMISGRDN